MTTVSDRLAAHGVLEIVERVVARHRGVTVEEVIDGIKIPTVTAARHEVWFALHDELRWTYSRIGRVFGFDHSSIMSGVRKASERHADDEATRHDALEAMQSSAGDDGWSALQSPWGGSVLS